MSVIETRAKVSIVDGATANLKSIASATDRMTASLNHGGTAAKGFSVSMKSLTSSDAMTKSISNASANFEKSANSISNMNKMINRLTYSVMRYTVIYEGIQKLGDLWNTVIGGAYEYGNMIETNQVGMAGILSSMLEINGKQLSWNQSLQISSKIMKDLQNESLKTSATAGELIDTFRALMGPGLNAGMSLEQIEKFTTVGVTAVKSLGLDGIQLVQELRDLVQGGIRPASSTLATALGITDADVKKAKQSSEGLYKFLMDRMKGFEYASLETNNTVKGRLDQIKEGLQRGVAEGTEPLRGIFSSTLKELGDSVIKVNRQTMEWKVNPEFVDSLKTASDTVIKLGTGAKNVATELAPMASALGGTAFAGIGQLADNLGYIAAAWGVIKFSKIAKDMLQILTVSRENREIQTSFGRFWQGLNDKMSGYAAKQKEAAEREKERLAWIEEENKLIDDAIISCDKIVSRISNSAKEAETLNGMVKANADSVVNLAEKWQAMGMSAKEAIATQNKIVWLTNNGYSLEAMNQTRSGNARADEIKQQEEQQKHAIELYRQQKSAIDSVIAAEHERQMQVKNTAKDELNEIALLAKKINMRGDKTDRARFNVDSFLSVDTSDGPVKTKDRTVWAWQQDEVAKLRDELHKLKLSEDVVQQTTEKFMDSLKSGMKSKVAPVFEQAVNSAKVWNATIEASLEKTARMSNEQINYSKFMASGMLEQNIGKAGAASVKGFATTTLETATEQFKKVGMAADEARQKAYEFTNAFIQGLKSIDATNLISVENLMKEVMNAAENYANKYKLVREQTEAVTKANAEAALEFDALSNAFKLGGEEAYQSAKKMLTVSRELQAALSERGAAEQANAVYKEMINYLNQLASAKDKAALATEKEMTATKECTEALKDHKRLQEEAASAIEICTKRLSKWTGIVSMATLNLSIMSDMVASSDDENAEWAKTLGDAAMKVSMVTMAIGSMIDIFPTMINGVKTAIKWFKELAIVKSAVALAGANPLAAMALVGTGAIAYGVWNKYKKAESGDTNLNSYFSDAELGGGMSGDDLFSNDSSQYKKRNLPTQSQADAADMEMFGTKAYDEANADYYTAWQKQQEKRAKEIEDMAKRARLIPEVARKDDVGSSKSGSKGKVALPELESTDALKAAFWYMQHGYSVYAAAALAGNQMQEAGRGNTESIDYEADNGQGYYGSVQWGGDRFKKLKDFSGGDWTNPENQLAFSDYELSDDPYYRTVGDKLKAAGSLEEANHIVFSQYEAPGDNTEGTRLSYAQQLLPRLLALQNKEATLNGETGSGRMLDLTRQREEQFKKLIDATNLTIRDTKSLNETTLSITGKQSAYDKTMQEANDKLEEYSNQILKDKQLGVDENVISRLQEAMNEYTEAMKQKAKEAQQTEIISRYDDQINSIQNRNLGFGEAGGRRDELVNAYSGLRDYLQEQLASDTLTYQQRVTLEQKLASTIKSINDQSAYDYKSAWSLALTELSNEQINWKDTWVSMFSSIETSMSDVLSGTGNFSTRMKSLFQNMGKSILKTISSVIAKMLMMKLVMGLFGGGSSAGSAKVGDAWTGGLIDSLNIAGGRATGGDVSRGKWYMVGENGPEMVRFGENGHVYNNSDTRRMLQSGGSGTQAIQIVVNNNTGTQMEAKQSVSQDSSGKVLHQIILTTVGEALTTNEYGLRDAIMGAR